MSIEAGREAGQGNVVFVLADAAEAWSAVRSQSSGTLPPCRVLLSLRLAGVTCHAGSSVSNSDGMLISRSMAWQ